MALIDRVKERIETDLGDAELAAMIAAVTEEIDTRFGANAAIAVQLGDERELAGHRRFHQLDRPADVDEDIAVVEIEPGNAGAAANRTTLAADDYRLLHNGRVIERLADGSNARTFWAPLVEVTYTPRSDAKRREEVIIQVLQLEVQQRGLSSERAGDWQATFDELSAAREKLIASLTPRRGLVMA